jgi:hypothetical protein
MERIRENIAAIVVGSVVALVVAAIIDGPEYLRVRSISIAYGHDYHDSRDVFVLVVATTFAFAAVALVVLSVARGADRKALVVLSALPLSLFAALPVYWYTYKGAPPGWHINIVEEHRWSQLAGVAAGLLAYAVARVIVLALRRGTREIPAA